MERVDKKDAQMSWGRRLSQLLRERKLLQKDVARAIHVSPSVLNGWLNGASPKDFSKVKALADYLKVSFTWLLTGESDGGESKFFVDDHFEAEQVIEGIVRLKIEKLKPLQRKRDKI